MEVIDFYIGEELDKEWTTFLDSFLWNSHLSIAESNKVFVARRKNWMNRMTRKFKVGLDQIKSRYVHD